jgi:hypothetical protein
MTKFIKHGIDVKKFQLPTRQRGLESWSKNRLRRA